MKSIVAGLSILPLLALSFGCSTNPASGLDPIEAELRQDSIDIAAFGAPAPEPEEPPYRRALNYAYQGFVRWPVAFLPSFTVGGLTALLSETVVWALIPASSKGFIEYQDCVDDINADLYHDGVNFRRMWNVTPDYLGARYDLVERDRREGLPTGTSVPTVNYPDVPMLVPTPSPNWAEPEPR